MAASRESTVPDDSVAGLRLVINRELKRARRKLEKQQLEQQEAHLAQAYQEAADTLLAHDVPVPRGTSRITLPNVHTRHDMEIVLNPAMDLHTNAALLYRKAAKARRAAEVVNRKVASTQQEIQRLEQAAQLCQVTAAADTFSDEDEQRLRTAQDILSGLGITPSMPSGHPGRIERRVPYRHFFDNGWDIYVGKNDEQNDELTTRFARPRDIWLHVAAHAGSHVVIRRPKDRDWPPRDILSKAAALAVWFSKAKHTSYAEVNMTEARFVHKRRGAPAGEVIAERCRSIRVTPRSPQELFCAPEPEFLREPLSGGEESENVR